MIPFVSGQCRINDNGKCSDRCGPRGPCVILNRWILEFRCQRQTLPMYFTHGKQTLFAETKLNFSFCLGSCSAWKYILHCKFLKSFDIQLSLSTHSSCWGAPFGIFTHNFCLFWQTHALLQNVLNVALEWLINKWVINKWSVKLQRGPSRHLRKWGCEATASIASLNIHSRLHILYKCGQWFAY